jgi:endonuclease/exonuclease/phosphatase family metal-dependent hydrolase
MGKAASAKKKSGFIRKAMLVGNILFIAALLLSYLAQYVSPETSWILAFFGISYPVILLGNLFFIVFWMFVKFRYALLSFVIIFAGYNNVFRLVQYSSKVDESTLKNSTKIISYNVRNFDLYNYDYKNNWAYNFERRNKIFNMLVKEQPDIVCFQEYVYDASHTFKTTDTLKQILKAKNTHIYYTANARNLIYFGVATYTVYPIIDTGTIAFNTVSGNVCIFTDVLINKDTVRIYNVHFESIRLKSEDYMFAKDVSDNKISNSELKSNSERILKRLKRAYIIRAPQARLVAEHIRKCPFPVILCGDFNDTPHSYAYNTVSKGLKDAFMESGSGTGKSYVGIFPSFRIDYVLHSPLFKAYNYETLPEELSDHYPIKCYLKKK